MSQDTREALEHAKELYQGSVMPSRGSTQNLLKAQTLAQIIMAEGILDMNDNVVRLSESVDKLYVSLLGSV